MGPSAGSTAPAYSAATQPASQLVQPPLVNSVHPALQPAKQPVYHTPQKVAPKLGSARRLPATPCRSSGGSRMELQTLLRRTREASGEMNVYIQEQYRFLRE